MNVIFNPRASIKKLHFFWHKMSVIKMWSLKFGVILKETLEVKKKKCYELYLLNC